MATNSIYRRTSLQIIQRALRTARIIDAETPAEGITLQNGFDALNGFVKFLQTEGFNLWRETEALLVLEKGKKKYLLGEGGDHCFDEDDFINTTLSADALLGDTLLSLTDITGMKAAENINGSDITISIQGWTETNGTITASSSGLELTNVTQAFVDHDLETVVGETYILLCDYTKETSSGANFSIRDLDGEITSLSLTVSGEVRLEFVARQTTSVIRFENAEATAGLTNSILSLNYIDKSTGDRIGVFLDDGTIQWSNIIYLSPFEIADSLTDNAATDNVIYSYTDLIPRPLSINNARFRSNLNFNDIPTTEWTRQQYQEQPNKATEGTVTKWYYSPQLGDGLLYVWQPASSNTALLPITFIRPIMVSEDNIDEIDFPSEWYDLISYGTANMLIAEYSVPDKVVVKIESKYAELLEQALGFDNDGYMAVEIDYEGRR